MQPRSRRGKNVSALTVIVDLCVVDSRQRPWRRRSSFARGITYHIVSLLLSWPRHLMNIFSKLSAMLRSSKGQRIIERFVCIKGSTYTPEHRWTRSIRYFCVLFAVVLHARSWICKMEFLPRERTSTAVHVGSAGIPLGTTVCFCVKLYRGMWICYLMKC